LLLLYRLSLGLGKTVRELSQKLTAEELEGYQAYYALEPWGCVGDDYRTAVVAHTVAASVGAKTKFRDFIPQWDSSSRTTAKELKAWARVHNEALRTNGVK
jgi:hypothetical protein